MRLDSLARLIESADFLAFRDIALQCLVLRGYQQVTLTDGWRDGGTDVRVFQMLPNQAKLAIQISVERDWRSKLRSDARKAQERLGITNLVYVSSRRIPESDFQRESERLFRDLGVRTLRIDSQGIASTFFTEGKSTEVLRHLGISVTSAPTGTRARIPDIRTVREDAAFAFVFFGKEVERFREALFESTIISLLANIQTPIQRSKLEASVTETLGLPDDMRKLVASRIDSLTQEGLIRSDDKKLLLAERVRDAVVAMKAVRESEWAKLREQVESRILRDTEPGPLAEEIVSTVMTRLGALLLATADEATASLRQEGPQSVFGAQIRRRLNELDSALEALGILSATTRGALRQDLTQMVTTADIGKQLLAGELFTLIAALKAPQLIRALGARSEIEVLLDASVAIPILCSVLYIPGGNRWAVAAHNLYVQLKERGFDARLPAPYLEEVATHLLLSLNYAPVIESDPDLTGSNNAFVAHFASLRLQGEDRGFANYLAGFGLDERLASGEFYSVRDALTPRIQRLFETYGIRLLELPHPMPKAVERAQKAQAYALKELELERAQIVLRHDTQVLAYMFAREGNTERASVLCTWDRVHMLVQRREKAEWMAMNPAMFGDILALALPEDAGVAVTSPLIVAQAVSEGAADAGGRVWDAIVRIEGDKLRDADVLGMAKEFKDAFVQRRMARDDEVNVARAWERWKAQAARS